MPRTLAVLALAFVSIPLHATDDLESQMKAIIGAYALIEQNAADPVTPDQAFYQGAIPGLLRQLDPHSVFFDPDQFEQLKKMESSTQKGFGTVVSLLPGRVIVLQTLPGTPSAKSGLSPGDEIVAINGYEVARLDMEQTAQLLGAARQQQARIDVLRPGTAGVMRFTLVPEDLQSPSVERVFFVGAGIGYIRVSNFDENTAQGIKEGIDRLGGNRLAGLILDLRNNPGGLVTAAIQTASLFLKPEMKILTVRGRRVPETSESVPNDAKPYTFKLAILINGKTASASEIVTGAMQDHDRATVLGEPSFGKGLVQSVIPVSEGAGVALTTALYYTPSGRSIQKPLAQEFELGSATAHPNAQSVFRTDKGRTVTGGGGIQPDFLIYPSNPTRLELVMDATGSFPDFATGYLRGHKVTVDFEVTPEILDEFRVFLASRNIQPGVGEWSSVQGYVRSRLEEEIFNQAIGVEKGDQVQVNRDPVIQKALGVLGS